jgi:magnesium-transporting ATPase (P-type)
MGSGNDVAKDTGAVIITDDNFASIVAGIEEGRRAYSNLRKVIYLLISTGAAEVVLFTLAVIFGMSIPLVAVQLLWLNLVTNGIQHVGLAFESREPGLMDRKPRDPQEGVFNRRMIEEVSVAGLTMSLVGFGVWWWLRTNNASLGDARNLLLLLFVMFENFHVFNCRSEYVSAFRMPLQKNLILLFGVIGAFGIHLASLYIPVLQEILQTNPVTLTQFGVLFLLASSVLIASEVFKLVRRRRD